MLQNSTICNNLTINYLRVSKSKGCFVLNNPDGDRGEFDTVSGAVSRIESRVHKGRNGKEFILWHVIMDDAAIGESYDISFAEKSGLFMILMRCLASEEGLHSLDDIEIQIRKASIDKFLNATVRHNGKSISWRPGNIPPIVYVPDGKRYRPDFSKRIDWLRNLVGIVNWTIDSGEIAVYEDDEYNGSKEGDEDDFEF